MQLINERDTRFYLGESLLNGAGKGLFCRVPLNQGDRFEVLGCIVMPGSQSDVCTAYADEYKLRFDENLLIPFGFAGMVNHSDTPNLEKIVIDNQLYFKAIRNIEVNEELFIRYSEYALNRFLKF